MDTDPESADDQADEIKWKNMFSRLADQISQDTDADIKQILHDVPISISPTNVTQSTLNPTKTLFEYALHSEPITLYRTDSVTSSEVNELQSEIESLKSENSKLRMENEIMSSDLQVAMSSLKEESQLGQILKSRIEEFELQIPQLKKEAEERLTSCRNEIISQSNEEHQKRIGSLCNMVQYLCDWSPKVSEKGLENMIAISIPCTTATLLDTSSKRIRTCPEIVQESANLKKTIKKDSMVCYPILDNGDTAKNVLYLEGISTSSQADSAKLAADILKLRLYSLSIKEKEASSAERCEILLNMITIVSNIESERARNSSVLCWAQTQLQSALKCQSCRIWLISEETRELVSFSGDHANTSCEHRKKLGCGIVGAVHVRRQHIMHNDALVNHREFDPNIDVPVDFDYRHCSSLLCVPAFDQNADGEPIDYGVVELIGKHDGQQFTSTDLEMVKLFCRRLCTALRRERRVRDQFEGFEKDLSSITLDRDRYKAQVNGCELITKLFDGESGDLYPSNFSTKVAAALRDALDAELVAIASVMPRHLLPYRLERVDKISHSPAFKRLAKQTIDSRCINIRDNVHVAKVTYPLLVTCTPVLDNLGRVIAVVFAGVEATKFAGHFSVILSIFANMCGAFLDRKHSQLNASATMRIRPVDDEPQQVKPNQTTELPIAEIHQPPPTVRVNSSIILSDDDLHLSRSSSLTNSEQIDSNVIESVAGRMNVDLTGSSSEPVSAWRDWMSTELGSDTEQEDIGPSVARSTSAEARIKSFALLHAGSVSNLLDASSVAVNSDSEDADNRRTSQQLSPHSFDTKPSLQPSTTSKANSPLLKRSSFRRLSRSGEGRDIEEVNEVMAALIIETDDSADTIEFMGGEIEYILPKAPEVQEEVLPSPPRLRRQHERIISSFDMKNLNLQSIFGPSDNIADIAEESQSYCSGDSEPSLNGTSIEPIPIPAVMKSSSRSPSVTSTVSSHRSSRAGSRRPIRKKTFSIEADMVINSEPVTPRSRASLKHFDDVNVSPSGHSEQFAQLEAENEEMIRIMNALAVKTDLINPSDESAAIRMVAEGALIAISVIITQTDMFQIRIGKMWYRWLPDSETISNPSPISHFSMPPALDEELDAAEGAAWKGQLCAYIGKGKEFSRVEFWALKAVAARLNMLMAYQWKLIEFTQKSVHECKEVSRLQLQLQMANSLIECARTATLSKGLQNVFGPDGCSLAKFLNAECAQLWLFDQTCTYLWTSALDSTTNGSLRTIKCPIDEVCLLTQVAVSRMSAFYHEDDVPDAYSEDYDGLSYGLKSSLKPRSLLMSAIGSDKEGVLGVIRVCNKCDPEAGNRSRFSSSDQKFLESVCNVLFDMVRSYRSSLKLQDRLEPAIKLAQTERQSRQRMQVLLSAQVSRLTKISKRALQLGEAASLASRFVETIWKISSTSSNCIREMLEESGLVFWRALGGFEQFCVFGTDRSLKYTNMRSLTSILELNSDLSEFLEHTYSSKEITENRMAFKDLRPIWPSMTGADGDRKSVIGLPILDNDENILGVCLAIGPETDQLLYNDQARLFGSVLGLWLQNLINISSLSARIDSQQAQVVEANVSLAQLNSRSSSFLQLAQLTVDVFANATTMSWETFLDMVQNLLSPCRIHLISRNDISDIWNLKPIDRAVSISSDAVVDFIPNCTDNDTAQLQSIYVLRSGLVDDHLMLIFSSNEWSSSQMDFCDYITRTAGAALCLRRHMDQLSDSMKICTQQFEQCRQDNSNLFQFFTVMNWIQVDVFQQLKSVGHTALHALVKEFAELIQYEQGRYIPILTDNTIVVDDVQISDSDLIQLLISSTITSADHQNQSVFCNFPISSPTFICTPVTALSGILIVSRSCPDTPSIYHIRCLEILAQTISMIGESGQAADQWRDTEAHLRRQYDEALDSERRARTDLDHALHMLKSTMKDWRDSILTTAPTRLEAVLHDIFDSMGFRYDGFHITADWARITSVDQLTSGLHDDFIQSAHQAMHTGTIISRSQQGSVVAMWIPVQYDHLLVQITRRSGTFTDMDLLCGSIYGNLINVLLTIRHFNEQLKQARSETEQLHAEVKAYYDQYQALRDLFTFILKLDIPCLDISAEQMCSLQSIWCRLIQADSVTIYKYHQSNSLQYPADEKTFTERTIQGSGNIMSWVVSTKSSYMLVDLKTDPRYNPESDAAGQYCTENLSGMLYVPLRDPDQELALGLLQCVRYDSTPQFTHKQLQFVELLADLIMNISRPRQYLEQIKPNSHTDERSEPNRSLELQLLTRAGTWRLDRSDHCLQIGRDLISFLHRRFDFCGAALFMLSDDVRYHLIYSDMSLAEGRKFDDVHFGARQGLLGTAVSSALLQIIPCVSSDERYLEFPDQWMSETLQSTLIMPIIDISSSCVSGLIQLINMRPCDLSQPYVAEADYLTSIAAFMSLLLQSNRLCRKFEQEALQSAEHLRGARQALSLSNEQIRISQISIQSLNEIMEFCSAIIGIVQLAPLFQAVQMFITKAFVADRAHLFLYDSEQNDLFTNITDPLSVAPRCVRLPSQTSAVGIVQRLGRPLLLFSPWNDATISSTELQNFNLGLGNLSWYKTCNISSMMVVPVYDHRQRIMGVVEVCQYNSTDGRRWTSDHISRMEIVCNRICSVLYNCKQFHQIRTQAISAQERIRQLEESLQDCHRNDDQRDRNGFRSHRNRQWTSIELEQMQQLQDQLQGALRENEQLRNQLSKLDSMLADREDQIQTSQKHIEQLEKDVRYAQMQFRMMIAESMDDDDTTQVHRSEMQQLQRDLDHIRCDNLQLINAMQSLISEYTADGNERVRTAIHQARNLLSRQIYNQ